MERKFKSLTAEEKDYIIIGYNKAKNKEEFQKKLSKEFGISTRSVRRWCNKLGVGLTKRNIVNPSRILIYDIETSRITAKVWWTGKQYVSYNQLREEPNIISIAWKWLGEDEVYCETWDKNKNDEKLLSKFLKVYNKADMVVGQNNDRFDNRWVNARAMKYGLDINVHVKSLDVMKECKRLFRLPSYSMAYITKFLGVETKLEHEGIIMWEKIEEGTKKEQKEYLKKMVDYNKQDIVATEDMYLALRKYMHNKVHFGVMNGEPKWTSPYTGTHNVKLVRTSVTPAGTVQRFLKCGDTDGVYKVSNKVYMDYLENKMRNKNKI